MATTEVTPTPGTDFLFINHDQKRVKTIKDRSHRAVVNQHVQKAWLKSKDSKSRKASDSSQRPQESSESSSPQLSSPDERESESLDGSISAKPQRPAPYKASQLIKFRTKESTSTRRKAAKSAKPIPCAPFNLLTHGNSDPFDTLAIPLDPTVSHLLQYSREVMIPSVYSMELRSKTPSLGIMKAWEHVTAAFEDECAISAYLAISATSVMRVSPSLDLVRVALKYSNRSSALLRARIAANNDEIDPRLYIIVLWLSANALTSGDFEAGMIHANTLCYLVRQGGGISAVDPFQRENILQFDVQFAMMFLRRPFFDPKDYAPGPFKKEWLNDSEAVCEPASKNQLKVCPPMTASITSPELVSILSDLRELHAVYVFTVQNPIPGTSSIFRWLYLQKHAVEARILEFCCELIYTPISPVDPSSPSQSTPPDLDAEYHSLLPPLCVAFLYWTVMAVGYSKQKIHACSMLLKQLRSLLCNAPSNFFTPQNQTFDNPNASLRLWILYVGALAEQAVGLSQPHDEWRDWCTRRFVAQMRWLNIDSPDQCREILEGVLFSDRMHREEGRWEGRTVWGKEDILVEKIEQKQESADGIEKWWGRDGKETGFETWWSTVMDGFADVSDNEVVG